MPRGEIDMKSLMARLNAAKQGQLDQLQAGATEMAQMYAFTYQAMRDETPFTDEQAYEITRDVMREVIRAQSART